MRFVLRRAPKMPHWNVRRPPWRRSLGVLGLLIGMAAISLYSIDYGMQLYRTRRAENLAALLEQLQASQLATLPHYVRGLAFAHPDRLDIEMKPSDYLELAGRRQEALRQGVLLGGDNDFVPATVHHGNQSVEVKLRLKGDWTDHLLGDKWSFRIKVKGDGSVYGMKQLSLQHPRTRNYAYEWLFQHALEREDILSLRYDFVDVTLNAKELGIYAVEEHFEKRLIENRRRREGPILRLNEELLWADRVGQPWNSGGVSVTGLESEQAAWVDGFGDAVLTDPAQFQKFQLAASLFERFRNGELATHQVFDARRLGTFYALCDLLGSMHAGVWHNLRFYFNPVTSLLEPIGFDANAGHRIVRPIGALRDADEPIKFKDRAFSDPVLFEEYVRALERMSQPGYLDTLLKETRPELDRRLTILYKEFPYVHFSPAVFKHNRAVIAAALDPAKGLHAYLRGRSAGALSLETGSIQSMPVEILGVVVRDSLTLAPAARVILSPRMPDRPVSYRVAEFPLPASLPASLPIGSHLKVMYRILGASITRSADVFPWQYETDIPPADDLVRQGQSITELDCVRVDEARKRIEFKPGTWAIVASVVIPPGYEVACGEGTEIDLGQNATLLSFSRLNFAGSESAPIVVRSQGPHGGSVAVMSRGEESVLEYVHFLNLSNPAHGGWSLTGAVTFYEAPARFSHCVFADNECEDALNTIRSRVSIEACVFRHTQADAFDSDFSTGRIAQTLFVDCGNDAIDVSGSVFEVVDCRIDGTGDKGVSSGENSQVVVRNLELVHAAIAVASKDLSELRGEKIRITDSQVGMTIFQKKPEFGPASMVVDQLQMTGVQVPYLVEQNSKLTLNGKRISPNQEKVRDELYGVRYGKASR
jgi:hypothetical protein